MPLNNEQIRIRAIHAALARMEERKTARLTSKLLDLEDVIVIGGHVHEQKAKGHGALKAWIENNFAMSWTTATDWMQVYENREHPQIRSAANITEAIRRAKALHREQKGKKTEEWVKVPMRLPRAEYEALVELTKGKSLADLATSLFRLYIQNPEAYENAIKNLCAEAA